MAEGVRLHRWDEIALEKVTEVISRKIVTGEKEMLSQIYLKRGAVVPMHKHEAEQLTYVLQGSIRFLVGGEDVTVREGEVLLFIIKQPLTIIFVTFIFRHFYRIW